MIFTKPKSKEEIFRALIPYKRLMILGCGSCSTDCHTGGEKEVAAMKKLLESRGKKVVGDAVIKSLCNVERVRRALKAREYETGEAQALLVMSCGIAVQVVSGWVEKPVLPALDTVFAGALERIGRYHEMCELCGHCVAGEYGGICPVSRCPKELLNGPCGGTVGGRCEVDSDTECVWVVIYERMKGMGMDDSLRYQAQPKDHARAVHPRRINNGAGILKGKW